MKNLLFSILVIAIAGPASAGDLSVEERLTRLEQEVAALRAENQTLRKQLGVTPTAPSPTAPQAVPQPAQDAKRLVFGGLLQAQAESGGLPDSRFKGSNDRIYVRRARLNAQAQLPYHTEARIELDLAGSLAPSTSARAQMTDGYLTWTGSRIASLRAGQFKTPFGHEQLMADAKLVTPERSLASDRLTPGRQAGAQISGEGAGGRVTYAIGLFNGNGTNSSNNDDDRFLTAARAAGVLYRSGPLRWTAGVNGFTSRDRAVAYSSDFGFTSRVTGLADVFTGSRRGAGVDSQLVAGPAEIWAEYIATTFEPDDAIPSSRFKTSGWSLLGSWMFVPERLQGVVRLEEFDPNGQLSNDETRAWSAGANWLIRGNDLKLQLFYMHGSTGGHDDGRVVARVQTAF